MKQHRHMSWGHASAPASLRVCPQRGPGPESIRPEVPDASLQATEGPGGPARVECPFAGAAALTARLPEPPAAATGRKPDVLFEFGCWGHRFADNGAAELDALQAALEAGVDGRSSGSEAYRVAGTSAMKC